MTPSCSLAFAPSPCVLDMIRNGVRSTSPPLYLLVIHGRTNPSDVFFRMLPWFIFSPLLISHDIQGFYTLLRPPADYLALGALSVCVSGCKLSDGLMGCKPMLAAAICAPPCRKHHHSWRSKSDLVIVSQSCIKPVCMSHNTWSWT
jgi:hypothetical protein